MKIEQRINYGYIIYDITGDITDENFAEIEDNIKNTLRVSLSDSDENRVKK